MDYTKLLERVREKLPKDRCSSDRLKMPLIDSFVEGSKTISTNLHNVANYLNRDEAHVVKFIAKELATSSIIEKGDRVIFTGKFPNRMINLKLEAYVANYVRCKECCSADTKLEKEDIVTIIHCMECQAKRPVPKIR